MPDQPPKIDVFEKYKRAIKAFNTRFESAREKVERGEDLDNVVEELEALLAEHQKLTVSDYAAISRSLKGNQEKTDELIELVEPLDELGDEIKQLITAAKEIKTRLESLARPIKTKEDANTVQAEIEKLSQKIKDAGDFEALRAITAEIQSLQNKLTVWLIANMGQAAAADEEADAVKDKEGFGEKLRNWGRNRIEARWGSPVERLEKKIRKKVSKAITEAGGEGASMGQIMAYLEKPEDVKLNKKTQSDLMPLLFYAHEAGIIKLTDEALGKADDEDKAMAAKLAEKAKEKIKKGKRNNDRDILKMWLRMNKHRLAKLSFVEEIVKPVKKEGDKPSEVMKTLIADFYALPQIRALGITNEVLLKAAADGGSSIEGRLIATNDDKSWDSLKEVEKKALFAVIVEAIGGTANEEAVKNVISFIKRETPVSGPGPDAAASAEKAKKVEEAKRKLKELFKTQLAAVEVQDDDEAKRRMFEEIDDDSENREDFLLLALNSLKSANSENIDAGAIEEFLNRDDKVNAMRALILVSQVEDIYNSLSGGAKINKLSAFKDLVSKLSSL